MSERGPRPTSGSARPRTAGERKQRKKQVLTRKSPSRVRSIADAVVIKDEDVFFLSQRDGQVPLQGRHGFGLYYHDCRYLNGYELRLGGKAANALIATPRRGFMAVVELTNAAYAAGGGQVGQQQVGVRWERVIDSRAPALYDRLVLYNYSLHAIEVPLALTLRSAFEDVFEVRGLLKAKRGTLRDPAWEGGELVFAYDGADDLRRRLRVRFTPAPDEADGTTARFRVRLGPRERGQVEVLLAIVEAPEHEAAHAAERVDPQRIEDDLHRSADEWLGKQTRLQSDSLFLEQIIDRSLRDLRVLRSGLEGREFFAAGVPWFATLFGRDSIVAALQTLAFDPGVAGPTLRLLARYQGTEHDDWRDEEPGKILHELRVGELARTGQIPHTPYYGSIDSTPLFLILLGRHAAWAGDLGLFRDLRGHVEAALGWMDANAAAHGGYLAYESASKRGLANQGWKDSGDAIVNADGSLAEPPIALAEVQGYAYLAKLGVAELFERDGDAGRAKRLREQAAELRERFNRDFWLEDRGFYALALQAGGRPAAVIASNPGQALWTGIVDEDRGRRVGERLLADDMFTGWGVRTLSGEERRYNPIGYHLGTVWPHDNSLIAAGLRRYGLDDQAGRIFSGIAEAATHFHAYRLPEVFAGFRRDDFGTPVRYPVACHPQAWAAGAVPYLLVTMLGLTPEAFDRRLRVVRPRLPRMASRVELHGLRVGGASVDLRFERAEDGTVGVRVLAAKGELDVVIEAETPAGGEGRRGGR